MERGFFGLSECVAGSAANSLAHSSFSAPCRDFERPQSTGTLPETCSRRRKEADYFGRKGRIVRLLTLAATNSKTRSEHTVGNRTNAVAFLMGRSRRVGTRLPGENLFAGAGVGPLFVPAPGALRTCARDCEPLWLALQFPLLQ